MADWSKLSDDLIALIAKRLHFSEDYAKFGAVCKSWRAITLRRDHKSCSLLPGLVLVDLFGKASFHCHFRRKTYDFRMPEIRGLCWGSSHGWLVTLNEKCQINLCNPMLRVEISLPRQQTYSPFLENPHSLYKIVLSSDPLSANCMVLAIYLGGGMAFAKPGDDCWTLIRFFPSFVVDAIWFDGIFYAVNRSKQVILCDSNGIHLKTLSLKPLLKIRDDDDKNPLYIVEIGGQIHVVLRVIQGGLGFNLLQRTRSFKIYKVDFCKEKLEEVKSLGNWCIFIGCNESFSISSCDYPECFKNCIYFTDVSAAYFPHDMGIYSLDDSSIRGFTENDHFLFSNFKPFWLKPVF